ncbi:hypothetical protein [Nocardia aurea]|uniref:Uncharacterized protein n=1 Tax=Nocardia aurea TaxID=2144174 RepID=A0ABV3FY93_9NOCA
MSKNGKYNPRRPEKGRNRPNRPAHRVTVRSVKRTLPDLRQLGRAVIRAALAEADAERAEQAEHRASGTNSTSARATDHRESADEQ